MSNSTTVTTPTATVTSTGLRAEYAQLAAELRNAYVTGEVTIIVRAGTPTAIKVTRLAALREQLRQQEFSR